MEELFKHDYYLRILVAIVCGSIIGLERQYRNKAAGFRTIVLICMGSAIFTIVSQRIGGSEDRVAANILTGIGFIGAGVIFNDRFNIKGLTTAAVIWVMAAIGMVIGINDYQMGFLLTLVVLLVLSALHFLEKSIDNRFHLITFSISFNKNDKHCIDELKVLLVDRKFKAKHIKTILNNEQLTTVWEVTGAHHKISRLNHHLINWSAVKSYEVH